QQVLAQRVAEELGDQVTEDIGRLVTVVPRGYAQAAEGTGRWRGAVGVDDHVQRHLRPCADALVEVWHGGQPVECGPELLDVAAPGAEVRRLHGAGPTSCRDDIPRLGEREAKACRVSEAC